ncbi:hypothetical protein K470DRAFT_256954 [Piedraia hortae CBS 480.64]|uniref:Uncharacterized protein n=1 Tax=Piedraia hortae CBS 480.64 TaxID=1314780 RepID=A0A6A7C1X2_9PEZI|nr:hypothetical protein K470DRAFT_256954 [Piedraia hortae CBS 480.64]
MADAQRVQNANQSDIPMVLIRATSSWLTFTCIGVSVAQWLMEHRSLLLPVGFHW